MKYLFFAFMFLASVGYSAEYPMLVEGPSGFPGSVSEVTVLTANDIPTTMTLDIGLRVEHNTPTTTGSLLVAQDADGNLDWGDASDISSSFDDGAVIYSDGTNLQGLLGEQHKFLGYNFATGDLGWQNLLTLSDAVPGAAYSGYSAFSRRYVNMPNAAATIDDTQFGPSVPTLFNQSGDDRDAKIGASGLPSFFHLDASDPSINVGAGHVTIGTPSVENTGAGDLNVGDDLYVDGGLEIGNSGVTGFAFNASGDFIAGEGVLSGGDALAWDQSAGELYMLDGASTEVHLISVGGVEINRGGAAIQTTISSDNLDVITVTAADELDLLGDFDWDAASVTGNASTGEWTFASEIQATAGVQAHTYLELFKNGNIYGVRTSGFANPIFEMSGSASTGDVYIKAENPVVAGGDVEIHAHGDDDTVSIIDGIFEIQEAFAYLADTPAQITSNQNDYNMGYTTTIRLSTDASRDITGIAYKTDGQRYEIWNVGSNDIVLKHQDTNSSAANRIICSTGADITLSANEGAVAWYDTVDDRWRVYKV